MKKLRLLIIFVSLLGGGSLLLTDGISTAQAAGSWRVVPIRLDLDQKSRSGSITLHNEGDAPVNLQMRAVQWKQDAQGKDQYEESAELVYFPKILTLPPGESRVLRSGINIPATSQEKTFRLFIEELPAPRQSEGAAVAIAVRFGVPVFVAPLKPEMRGEVGALTLKSDGVELPVRNLGNVHFRIQALYLVGRDEAGVELFRQKTDGWYLLAQAERFYSLPFPPEGCGKAVTLEVLINTDKGNFSTKEKLPAGLCRP